MAKQIELEQLDRTIKDGEIRLRTLKTNIDSITKEIDLLVELQSQLIENIEFLKSIKIIVKADEFKKAKEDLAKTLIRLVTLKNDRAYFKKAIDDMDILILKSKQDLEKLIYANDNVIQGQFGRKKDGQG